jgi:hypothetical protein
LIRRITQRHFPEGFTILEASGGWFDPGTKRFVVEESRQILVCAPNRRLAPWCRELAQAFRQQELLVVELGPARRFRPAGKRQPKRTGQTVTGRRPTADATARPGG